MNILTLAFSILLPAYGFANSQIRDRFEVAGIIGGNQNQGKASTGVALIHDKKKNKTIVVSVGKPIKAIRGLTLTDIDGKKVVVTHRSKEILLDWQAKPSSKEFTSSKAIAYRDTKTKPAQNEKPKEDYGLTPKLEQYLRSLEDGSAEPDDELEQKLLDEWFEVDPELLEDFQPENNEYREYRGKKTAPQKKLGNFKPPSRNL